MSSSTAPFSTAEAADPDAPTSSRPSILKAAPPTTKPAGQSAATAPPDDTSDADDDDEDDDVPDYTLLAGLAAKAKAAGGLMPDAEGSTTAAFIPKRGEKDFEPTNFGGQRRALEKSRAAMLEAISGERRTNSKNISIGTWEPSLNRVVVHIARGSTFSAFGVTRRVQQTIDGLDADLCDTASPEIAGVTKEGIFYPRTRARLELFPEEAIYLVERGALECRLRVPGSKRPREEDIESDRAWIGMSVQHAFAEMLWKDGCTRERYQTFAYLKRLGYPVQRASVSDELRKAASEARKAAAAAPASQEPVEPKGAWMDHKRPLRLVTIYDLLLYPLRRLAQLLGDAVQWAEAKARGSARWIRQRAGGALGARKAATGSGVGTGVLGIGGRQWDSFDSVFAALQIVPSGHDAPRVVATPTPEPPRFPIYYYAWRPATRFKRSDPPLPEFRICIVDARATSLPSMAEFAQCFGAVPLPGTDELSAEDAQRAAAEKKRNDESYGRGAVRVREAQKRDAQRVLREKESRGKMGESIDALPTLLRVPAQNTERALLGVSAALLWAFGHAPGCFRKPIYGKPKRRNFNAPNGAPRPPNVFPPLKAGRRTFVLAIVDQGISSLLRFGETEFAKWRLAGEGGAGKGT